MHVRPFRERPFLRRLAACAVVLWLPLHVLAQPKAVGVLRSSGSDLSSDFTSSVDQALLRNLAELADIHDPLVSPAAYEEVQLTVGCDGESRECLSSVAQTLQVEAIVVSRLSADDNGLTTLELIYAVNGGDRAPASAQTTRPLSSSSEIVSEVPHLVRKLFALPEPASETAPASSPAAIPAEEPASLPTTHADADATESMPAREPATHDAGVGVLTWVTLISGAGVFGAGAVVGLGATSSFDDLKKAPVKTDTDAQRVRSELDSIQKRGTVANLLMPFGGAILGVGAVLLILDLSDGDEAPPRDTAAIDVMPLRGGMAVTFSSAFEGG